MQPSEHFQDQLTEHQLASLLADTGVRPATARRVMWPVDLLLFGLPTAWALGYLYVACTL